MQTEEHPDELTPREREVFDLLRLGLTNEEIAERLGISLDGAKYHVSQILSKLGVSSREEAAAAEAGKPRLREAGQRGRWWAALPLAAKAAGAAVVLTAVAGLGVLAWGVANTGGGTEAGDGTLTGVAGPRIGDHWHIPYQFFVCGEKQPNAATWESGVHTHGDGIIHIHPFQKFEEGSGASLVKWFEYGGGILTNSEIRIPGSLKTWGNGDTCPDGKQGELQVFVTRPGNSREERLHGNDLEQYLPHDGDRIRIVFGPPEESVQTGDRTIIPETQATRVIGVTVTDDGTEANTRFEPATLQVSQGEVVKLAVTNTGKISHGFRAAGADGNFGTSDDFVVTPDGEKPDVTAGILRPGAQGAAIVRIDVTGEIPFRDETLQDKTGTIVVRKSDATPPPPADVGALHLCRASDLTVDWFGENGAGGTNFGTYAIGNRSASPCGFAGPPEVKLIDASGAEMQINLRHSQPCSPDHPAEQADCEELEPVVLRPGTGTVTRHVAVPGQALLTLAWHNGNGASDCGAPRAAKVRFVMPGGSTLDAEIRSEIRLAPCEGQLQIWAFYAVASTSPAP